MPERYTYDKTGQKQPLNELALDLIPGDYGRAAVSYTHLDVYKRQGCWAGPFPIK